MVGRFKSFPYSVVLYFAAVTLAAAMVGLLAFEWTQRKSLQEQADRRVDSVTAPAFLLDREYLRFVHSLDGYLHSRNPPSLDELQIRLDVLTSRVDVLHESPGSEMLLQHAKVAQALAQVVVFIQRADAALAGPEVDLPALTQLHLELQDFAVESLALGNVADLQGSWLLEQQSHSLLDQNLQITWMTLGQLLLLLMLAGGLSWRNTLQRQEEKALLVLNEELQKAQQEAVSANLGKSLFLANMSHELRTPFNGVMGLLSLLKATPLSAEQSELVNIANDSAGHLLQLLNDILDMSALEQGKITLRMETLHLSGFLAQIETTFKPLAAQKNLHFEMQSTVEPDVWIAADPTRLRQILFNLISNAIKFTPCGQVVLRGRVYPAQSGQPWMELQVQDTGIGMSEEALGKLFQRFYQADSGLSRQFSGIGLGLQISLSLARRMGGDITVESMPLQGSTFTLRLPMIVRTPPDERVVPTVALVPPLTLNKATRILVAEDHAVNQKFMALMLERLGYDATFCDNGKAAVEAIAAAPYDLVFMDIHMPVMDGLTATRTIRAMPGPQSKVPIIALTADVLLEARSQAEAAGVNAFITKPVKQAELVSAIVQVLESTRQAESGGFTGS
ncbi:MAG: ATP-binding protein [Rhodoferax sp.]|nr:ATP-binding protein [Rhodoferax sp.]